jgi:hypothetical protein
VSIGYGSCRVGSIHVQTMNFFAMGNTPPCCHYWVRPDPAAPSNQVEVVDCNNSLLYATGGLGFINPGPGCTCGYPCPVPVEETTWGRVKAVYSE